MKPLEPKKSRAAWQKVYDEHRPPRRVRGIWRRYDTLYATLDASDSKTFFYPLHSPPSVAEAVLERQALKKLQQAGTLLPSRQVAVEEEKTLQSLKGLTLAEAVSGYHKDRDTLKSKDEATGAREDPRFACHADPVWGAGQD